MDVIEILAKKRDGLALSRGEIEFFVRGAVQGSITDYQAAAFLMAARINGLDLAETRTLTQAMLHSGEIMDLSDVDGIKVDKHSSGGVGDKTSLVLMPLVAAAGLKGAKMSGRGLGHTGGTLDKLESIPGFRTDLSMAAFKKQVREIGLSIIAQSADLVPADKLFYALRDVTATVDSIPLIAASIMSKKLAMGADILVLDVKYGSGALIREKERCRELARLMVDVGKDAGMKASALITSMSQPLGYAVGNALEVREALDVLEGGGPADLRHETLAIAGEMLLSAGMAEHREAAFAQGEKILKSGLAREKFAAMVRAQGGTDDFRRLPQAQTVHPYRAKKAGWLNGFQTDQVGHAAMLLGAGRRTKEDTVDPAVGIVFTVKAGAEVEIGDTVALLHCNAKEALSSVESLLDRALVIEETPREAEPLIWDIVS